jgi:hypothetical protein
MVKKKNTDIPVVEEVIEETKAKPSRRRGKAEAKVEVPAETTETKSRSKKKVEEAPVEEVKPAVSGISLIFKAPDLPTPKVDSKRGKIIDAPDTNADGSHRRVRSRRRSGEAVEGELPPNVVVKVRTPRC